MSSTCATCNKADAPKRCSRCKLVSYCDRDCQVKSWPNHKTICQILSKMSNTTLTETPTSKSNSTQSVKKEEPTSKPIPKVSQSRMLVDHIDAMTAISSTNMHVSSLTGGTFDVKDQGLQLLRRDAGKNAYLSALSQDNAIKHFIDSFRLRCDDENKFNGIQIGIYCAHNPEGKAEAEFEKYLTQAEKKGVLPDWWNKEKRKEVLELVKDKEDSSCVYTLLNKQDVMEVYADTMMPMKLRGVAERVLGTGVQR